MNSFVDYNLGGHVIIAESTFQRLSNCGAVLRNSNPTVVNIKENSNSYTNYMVNFNFRNTLTSDKDCLDGHCYSTQIYNCSFLNFNYLKKIESYELTTNPDNGMEHHGYVLHLDDFNGDVTLENNTYEDIMVVRRWWSGHCFAWFRGSDPALAIYGTETTPIKTHLVHLNNHIGNIKVITQNISYCTSTSQHICVSQLSLEPVLILRNTITYSGTFLHGGAIKVEKQVDSTFENTDTAAITNLLSTATEAPCSGMLILENTLDHLSWCSNAGPQIILQCVNSAGSTYMPALTAEEISVIGNSNTQLYNVTYGGTTTEVDLNYLTFHHNVITHVLGATLATTFEINGFTQISIQHNTFDNNGRLLENKIGPWGNLERYTFNFFDSNTLGCVNSVAANTYGFIVITFSMKVNVNNNTVTNHFYTYESTNPAADFGSFIKFSKVYGRVSVSNLQAFNITGVLGDYNLNTLQTIGGGRFGYSNSTNAYQFIPVLVTDTTNRITSFTVTNSSISNSIARYGGSSGAGLFLHVPRNSITQYIDVDSIEISTFESVNCYIYGFGGLIFRYGSINIQDVYLYHYGHTQPMISTIVSEGAPIIIKARPDHYVNIQNVTALENVGGEQGSCFYIEGADSQNVTALTSNNVEISNCVVANWSNTGNSLKISGAGLTILVQNISITENSNTDGSSIYLTGGGIMSFQEVFMENNTGGLSSEMGIVSCTGWEINISNSIFTKEEITITGNDTFDQSSAIYISLGGTVQFNSCDFKKYLLAVDGGVIFAFDSDIIVNMSEFVYNSAQYGGAIYITERSTLSISSSIFINNTASKKGGVVHAELNSQVDTFNCTFTSNTAASDAVITCSQGTTYNDANSTISLNLATTKNCFGSISQGRGSVFNGTKFIENSVTGSEGMLLYNLFNDILLLEVEVRDNTFAGGVKNFYIIASTAVVESSNFIVNNPVTLANDTSTGGFLYLFGCIATVNYSNFTGGRAEYGGAIYVLGSSYDSDSCRFIDNRAVTSGGAYYLFVAGTFESNNEVFINNKAKEGDCVGYNNVREYATLRNASMTSNVPPQFIYGKSGGIRLEDCLLEQTDGFDMISPDSISNGAGISVDSTVRLDIRRSHFKDLTVLNGVIYIVESLTGLTLGVLYKFNVARGERLAYVEGNVFSDSESYGEKGGTFVYYEWEEDEGCVLEFSGNTFENGLSNASGGGILWTYDEPIGLETSTFINNDARLYGDDIAGVPVELKVVSEEFYNANVATEGMLTVEEANPYPDYTLKYQQSGSNMPIMYFGVFDKYGQLVKTVNGPILSASIKLNLSEKYEAFISIAETIRAANGLFKAQNISITATPGTYQEVTFTTPGIDETIPAVSKYLTEQNRKNSGLKFTVHVRQCVEGEAFKDDGSCETCRAELEYSLEPPKSESSCLSCPFSYAQCLGGYKVVPKPGYWSPGNLTADFVGWFIPGVCLGYTEENQAYQGECVTGYQGIVCGDCEPGYSRIGNYECGKCPKEIWNVLRVIGFLLGFLIVILAILFVTLRSAGHKKNTLTVFGRIMVNHLQMLAIIYSFRLEWPDGYSLLFETAEPAAEVTEQFVSFDCFLDQRTPDNLDANPMPLYYYRVLIASVAPIIVIILSAIFWNIFFHFKLKKGEDKYYITEEGEHITWNKVKMNRIIATNLIVLVFIHPGILNITFEMFNCVGVDGTLRFGGQLGVECYKGLHLLLVLLVAGPASLAWGICIPLYALNKLREKKNRLDKQETREQLGFLYNGYTSAAYYWEPVIMFRKVLMVGAATVIGAVGRQMQAMIGLYLLIGWAVLHCAMWPFLTHPLNTLEFVSIMALCVSILAGTFFVTDSSNNPTSLQTKDAFSLKTYEKTVIFGLFILANIIFGIYWFKLLYYESKKFMRLREQGCYYTFCLCRDKTRIEEEKIAIEKHLLKDEYSDYTDSLSGMLDGLKYDGTFVDYPDLRLKVVAINEAALEIKVDAINYNLLGKEELDEVPRQPPKTVLQYLEEDVELQEIMNLNGTMDQLTKENLRKKAQEKREERAKAKNKVADEAQLKKRKERYASKSPAIQEVTEQSEYEEVPDKSFDEEPKTSDLINTSGWGDNSRTPF